MISLRLLLSPASADTQDKIALAHILESRDHLRQQRGIAKELARHKVLIRQFGAQGRQIGQRRPAFQNRGVAKLEVISHPDRIEMPHNRIQSRAKPLEELWPWKIIRRVDWEIQAKLNLRHLLLSLSYM